MIDHKNKLFMIDSVNWIEIQSFTLPPFLSVHLSIKFHLRVAATECVLVESINALINEHIFGTESIAFIANLFKTFRTYFWHNIGY